MDKKLTDSESIKALECCISGDCDNCPYDEQTACNEYMKQDALDLINRLQERVDDLERNDLPRCKDALRRANEMGIELQAENERLKSKLEPQGFEEADPMDFCGVLCDFAEGLIEKAKAEAYKEFAERLKEKYGYYDWENKTIVYPDEEIDNLLKELVGD